MTVEEFLQNYGGNECVSIEGYCEEASYDYYAEVDEDYPMRRKTPCFSYGDIRRVHRIYASN